MRDRSQPTLAATRWTPALTDKDRARRSLRTPTGWLSMRTWTVGQAIPVQPTIWTTMVGSLYGSVSTVDLPGVGSPHLMSRRGDYLRVSLDWAWRRLSCVVHDRPEACHAVSV